MLQDYILCDLHIWNSGRNVANFGTKQTFLLDIIYLI